MTVFVDRDCPVRGAQYEALMKAIKRLYQHSCKSNAETAVLLELLREAAASMHALMETYPAKDELGREI